MLQLCVRLALCALLCIGGSFVVAAEKTTGPQQVRIGVASSLTGDIASHGIPTYNATVLAAEFMNKQGGVLGMPVVVIAQDDQCKPELAINAATKLISEGVNGVIGHICSGATKAALPVYNNAKLVTVSPAATAPELTQSGEFPFFFRTIANNNAQGKLAASFISNKLKPTKVAILHDNTEYGRGYAETVQALFPPESRVRVVLFEAINPDAGDFSSVIRTIRRSGAQALILGAYHPTAAKMVQQLRREKLKIPCIGPDSIKDEAFIRMAGAAAEGCYASSPSDNSKNPLSQRARAQHIQKFGTEPGVFFDNAYAAALALMQGMNKAGTISDAGKIAEAMRTCYVETPSGRIRFNNKGDAVGVGLSMYQVHKGKFAELDYRMLLD